MVQGYRSGGSKMKISRWLVWFLLIILSGSAMSQTSSTSVEMLREMFRRPVTEWREHLKQNQSLLNEGFLADVERRIRWGIENNHVDDAFRFAMVGDFAAELKKRPANFRIDLAELFFKAENYVMTGQVVDNILISSPGTPPALRAQFLRGRLLEIKRDLFAAHQVYRELAESRYEPETTWYKAGQISLLIQEEARAKEEFEKAVAAGNRDASEYLARMNALNNQGFNPIAPIPNTPESGVLDPQEKRPTVLATARLAAADGRLDEAVTHYQMALAAESDKLVVYREYSAVLYRNGTLDEALKVLNDALGKNPQDVDLLRIRGNTQERMFDRHGRSDDLKKAIEDYRKAIQMAPDHEFLSWELRRAQAKN